MQFMRESWVTKAKKIFSKNGCVAYQIGKDYLTGSPMRQEYLETAVKWISENQIEDYMGNNQHDSIRCPFVELLSIGNNLDRGCFYQKAETNERGGLGDSVQLLQKQKTQP